jgi:hypothetical protein
VWCAFERIFGRSWSRRFAAVISIYTRPLVRAHVGVRPFLFMLRALAHGGLLSVTRHLVRFTGARLSESEREALTFRANQCGMRSGEYIRFLILSDLRSVTEDRLLQTVEAEHTRLALLAARQGKPLNQATLRELRSQAILNAPALVEQTVRLLRQQRNGGQQR